MKTGNSQPSRKEREEEFRRNLVLDIAEALFAEKGFHGTTVADIAEAAELAKGSLYQLFESKEELISAIIRRKIDGIHSEINKAFTSECSPSEKIHKIIEIKLLSIWENRKFARIFFHELRGFHWCIETPLIELYQSEIGHMLDQIEHIFKEGQEKGEFRTDMSASTMVYALGGLSNGIVFQWLKNPESIDAEEAIREVQELFLNGIRPIEGRIELED